MDFPYKIYIYISRWACLATYTSKYREFPEVYGKQCGYDNKFTEFYRKI